MLNHPFPPLYDENSKVLILGSFPSVKSREQNFFYGHPQNRFWKVVSAVIGTDTPVSIEEKSNFLHENHIALWDVIASCDITGSSDSSIKNVVANDLQTYLKMLISGRFSLTAKPLKSITTSTSVTLSTEKLFVCPQPHPQMPDGVWKNLLKRGR